MELAFRHVRATLPERRAFLKNLPENPLEGIEAFKRLLTEQGLRRLSRECWRTMHQARGRLVADVDASTLSDLIVGVAEMNFARFAFGPSGTIEDLLRIGHPHCADPAGTSARQTIQAAAANENGVDSKFELRRLVPAFTLRFPASRWLGADSRRRAFGRDN